MTSLRRAFALWLDSGAALPGQDDENRVDWPRILPFVLLHLSCAAALWVGVSAPAIATAAALYLVRMFAITAGYHRYFSHRAFATSRAGQLVLAILGAAAVQRGALWWAAHHRHHHAHADGVNDVHSPLQHGFLWSHVGWLTSRASFKTRLALVPDLALP